MVIGDGSDVPFLVSWYRILRVKSWTMVVAGCWRAAATMYPSLEFPYEFIPKYACRHRSATRLEIRSRYIGRAAVTVSWCESRVRHVTHRYPFCTPSPRKNQQPLPLVSLDQLSNYLYGRTGTKVPKMALKNRPRSPTT